MGVDSDQLLNRLVVAALTIFIVASLLLMAFVVREIVLQEHIAGLSNTAQANLEELEETTDAIQSELSDIRSTPETESWDDVADLLEDVDQQLESVEENLDDVATVLDTTSGVPDEDLAGSPPVDVAQDRADQVFTIFAVLTAISAIALAVLLAVATRVQGRVPWKNDTRA